MGKDGFSWFVGVVEDRNDLLELGRVRVRVLGRHSENLTEVSTKDLPWAHVMHPVTDPSMQGLGHTPSFLTQGSWVVGFFRDNERQQPIIMGSLPGVPDSVADRSKGFNDPRGSIDDGGQSNPPYTSKYGPTYGPYPGNPINQGTRGATFQTSNHSIDESDTNRLARGIASETHQSLINRRAERISGTSSIPVATKPYLSNVSLTAEQEGRGSWEEPHPKGLPSSEDPYRSSAYPYNHVFESESGHITEVDDSPGAERLFRQHRVGTFEEIHTDGSIVTKIIGNNYEIVIGSEFISIKGSQNITVEGSVRELIKGDYIQEIEGDFYQKIHKNHRVKVGAADEDHPKGPGGNREEEIVGNYAFNINNDVNGRIGEDTMMNHEGSKTQIVGGQYTLSVAGKAMASNPESGDAPYALTGVGAGIYITTDSNYVLQVKTDLSQSTTSGIMSMKSGNKLNVKSATAMTIHSETTLSEVTGTNVTRTAGGTYSTTSTGNMSLNAPRIDLNL